MPALIGGPCEVAVGGLETGMGIPEGTEEVVELLH